MSKPIVPQMPFVWPEPRVSSGVGRYETELPFKAMNVAGDHLVEEYGGRKAKQRAELELDLIKQLEDASGDAMDKCRALWTLITTGKEDAVVALVEPGPLTQAAGAAGSR